MLRAFFHNGDEIAYSYLLPEDPPFGSGTHIIVKKIADGSLVKQWDYLGDKGYEWVSEDKVVWSDLRNDTVDDKNGNSSQYNSDIYILNLENIEESPIVTHPAIQDTPAIDGDLVVWIDMRDSPDPTGNSYQPCDIYLYDLVQKTTTNLTDGIPGNKRNIRISGKWVSFEMPTQQGFNFYAIDLEARGLYRR